MTPTKIELQKCFLITPFTWIISPYWSDSEISCSWWVSFTSVPTRKITFTFLRASASCAHDSLILYRASKLGTELHTMTRRKGWASAEVLEALHTSGLRMVVRWSGRISSRALRDWFAGQTNAKGPEIAVLNSIHHITNPLVMGSTFLSSTFENSFWYLKPEKY